MSDVISTLSTEQLDVEGELTFEEIMLELRKISASIREQQLEVDRLKAESDIISARTDRNLADLRIQLAVLEA